MAATETLTNLRSRSFTLADQVADKFISTTEMTFFLNSAGASFYRKFVQTGLVNYKSTQTITTVAGTAATALAATYYGTLGVYYSDSGKLYKLKEVPFSEHHKYSWNGNSDPAVGFMIDGSNITLFPTPASVKTYLHYYVPVYTKLVNGTDTIDGINGLEEYMVISAAIDCYMKEESNPVHLKDKLRDLEQDIMKAGADRLIGSYGRISDYSEDEEMNNADSSTYLWNRP
jgi:hypothetical protein